MYDNIAMNFVALEILPENGNILNQLSIWETNEVSCDFLPAEDWEEFINNFINIRIPDLQQNNLEID